MILDDVESIDGLIDDVNQKIERKRAMLGGVNAAAENTDAIDKQIKILENRLEKVKKPNVIIKLLDIFFIRA